MAARRGPAIGPDGPGMLRPHHAGKNSAEALIRPGLENPAQRIAGCDHRKRTRKADSGQRPAGIGRDGLAEVDAQARLGKVEDGFGVRPPRLVHGPYMLATIASANSLVRSRVAPSMRRWKS
jgi:hypothetical protein